MVPDLDLPQEAPPASGSRRGPTRSTPLVSTLAVVAMAVVAVAAAVMTTRQEERVARQAQAARPAAAREVVKAPPMVVTAPPLSPVQPATRTAGRSRTDSMGAGPGCAGCGVVETVSESRSGFRMRIRMDDGTAHTVEQRGALPAGSRVVVEAGSVRLLTRPG